MVSRIVPEGEKAGGRKPWPGFVIGVIGVVALCLVTPYNDDHLNNTLLYGQHLPLGGLFLFTVLALVVNPLSRRFRGRPALSTCDLLVFWTMVTTGAGLASSGLWRYLAPEVVAPAYFANAGTKWLTAFTKSPSWLLLSRDPNSTLVTWFYKGMPHGRAVPWKAWLPILGGWGAGFFCIVLFSVGACSLFRKQWVERERLSYPLAQIPLYITAGSEGSGDLLRSRALWAGVITVLVFHSLSTAHYFMPSAPQIPTVFDISSIQQTRPWNGLGLPNLEVFFAVIGAIFLLPGDVAFSLWFTYLGLHLFRVARFAAGFDPLLNGPLNQEGVMGAGAFVAMAAWMTWLARPHLREVWQGLWRPGSVDDRREVLGYRAMVFMTITGFLGFISWMIAAGLPPARSLMLALLSVLILLVLTRIMAESGLLFLQTPFIPTDLLACWGTQNTPAAVSSTSLLTEVVFIHDPREHIMPAIANADALVGSLRTSARFLTGAIFAAITIGYFVSFVSFIWTSYHFGAVTMDQYGSDGAPHWSLDRGLQYAQSPLPINYGDIAWFTTGIGLTAAMAALRARLVWWPLSPIGLAMASTYAMNRIYFSIFLGWICKSVIVRWGGLRLYRRALPFFLGLLLGEGIFGGLAAIFGLMTGVTGPPFLPT